MNDFFEKNLEDIVFENRATVHEKGFPMFYEKAVRQLVLPNSRRIDIFTWEIVDNNFYGKVIEFKREEIGDAAFFQVIDYSLEIWAALCGYFDKIHLERILVGTKINKNIKHANYYQKGMSIYEYSYGFEGIKFVNINPVADTIDEMTKEFTAEPSYLDFVNNLRY